MEPIKPKKLISHPREIVNIKESVVTLVSKCSERGKTCSYFIPNRMFRWNTEANPQSNISGESGLQHYPVSLPEVW